MINIQKEGTSHTHSKEHAQVGQYLQWLRSPPGLSSAQRPTRRIRTNSAPVQARCQIKLETRGGQREQVEPQQQWLQAGQVPPPPAVSRGHSRGSERESERGELSGSGPGVNGAKPT